MSVGETLRKAREAKGLSIEDVKNSTQIMARQLQELEEDDFSSCADPFYAKLFVRTFARAVGLDPAEVVRAFVEQTADGRGAVPKPAPKSVAAAPAPEPEPKPAPVPAAAAPAPEASAAAPAPDDLFSLAAAPKPAPEAAPAPAPEAEAPKPAAAPARTTAKVVASTPLAFERRRAPGPQPEKRVAPVEPGAPAPEPGGPERAVRREGRAEFVPPPAAKKLPEPPSAAFRGTPSDGRPVAPEPLPLAGPPFRFPEEAGDLPSSEAAAAAASAEAAPAPAPVLQSRQRKNLAPAPDEEIVAAPPATPASAQAAPAKDEPLFADKAPRRKREPRQDAPNAASLFFANLAASARKTLSRKSGRGPLLAGAAALVALCVAGGVYLASGGRGDGGSGTGAPASRPDASVAPADPDPAAAPEPPEPIAPVFPPPASWAK